MKQRSRSDARQSPTRPDSAYLKFLKPGALAQLRNSRLTSRSHRHIPSLPSPPPSPSPPPPVSSAGAALSIVIGGGGLLPPLSHGPRFPQRKKLLAAKIPKFLRPESPVTDSPDPIIGALSGGGGGGGDVVVVAAH